MSNSLYTSITIPSISNIHNIMSSIIYPSIYIFIFNYNHILHPYWLIMIDPFSWFMMVLLLLSPNPSSSRPKPRFKEFIWIHQIQGPENLLLNHSRDCFCFLHFGFLVDEKPKKRRKVSCLNQRRPHVVLLLLLSHFWHGSGRSVSAVRSDGKSFHPANGGPKIHRSEHQLESRTGRFWDRKSKFRSTVNSKICIISTIQPFSRDLSSVPWDVWCRNVRSRLCAHGSRDPLDVWIRPRPSLLGSKCPEWNTNSSGPCWVNHPVVGRWSLTLWGSYIFIVRIPY